MGTEWCWYALFLHDVSVFEGPAYFGRFLLNLNFRYSNGFRDPLFAVIRHGYMSKTLELGSELRWMIQGVHIVYQTFFETEACLICWLICKWFYTRHVQVVGVGINTEWGLLMASITEDNGEETPLQVIWVWNVMIMLKDLHFYDFNLFAYFILGSSEWGGNLHWHSWAHCSFTCSDCPNDQVVAEFNWCCFILHFTSFAPGVLV